MERLQKVIAARCYCSRRKAEELIVQGQVKVNNIVVTTLGTKVSKDDQIHINNKLIVNQNNEKVYLIDFLHNLLKKLQIFVKRH